jgi:hypothetical protein
MPSSDYALQAVKGIKESFDNAAKNDILQYKNVPIFTFETTEEYSEIFTSTESMSGVVELAEGQTPPTLALQDGYSVTITEKSFGGAIELTRRMIRQAKDSTTKIDTFVQRQRNALLRTNRAKFLTTIHGMLNDAFVGASYLAPDTAAICATHTWKSGATFSNNTTSALSLSAWEAVEGVGGAFVDSAGIYFPMNFDTIVVKKGGSAAIMAKKLFASNIAPTHVADVNIFEGGSVTVIETPGITSATAWFAMDSMQDSPLYVGINSFPYLDEPIIQNNASVRTNCFGDYKVGVNNMPFAIYGSTGTV